MLSDAGFKEKAHLKTRSLSSFTHHLLFEIHKTFGNFWNPNEGFLNETMQASRCKRNHYESSGLIWVSEEDHFLRDI